MQPPLISVCIPTYEPNPEHLKAALESLLAQTETRWHAIIHDDASKADTEAIVRPYLQDSRFQFVRSPERSGIGGNWNACLSHARAPYVQYLFQDDLWQPQLLAASVAALERHPEVGLLSIDHHYAFEDIESEIVDLYRSFESQRRALAPKQPRPGRDLLREWMQMGLSPNIIGEPCFVMLRRTLIDRVGRFDEYMPQTLDTEYWVRALPHTHWFALEGDLGTFRVHGAGASERNRREGRGLFDRFTCMERVVRHADGRERGQLRAVFVGHLETMIIKYLQRKKGGAVVVRAGMGAVRAFALRHPLLVGRAFLRAWRAARA